MIVLVTHTETNSHGLKQIIVSHGIDMETGRNVVLQQESRRSSAPSSMRKWANGS